MTKANMTYKEKRKSEMESVGCSEGGLNSEFCMQQ